MLLPPPPRPYLPKSKSEEELECPAAAWFPRRFERAAERRGREWKRKGKRNRKKRGIASGSRAAAFLALAALVPSWCSRAVAVREKKLMSAMVAPAAAAAAVGHEQLKLHPWNHYFCTKIRVCFWI